MARLPRIRLRRGVCRAGAAEPARHRADRRCNRSRLPHRQAALPFCTGPGKRFPPSCPDRRAQGFEGGVPLGADRGHGRRLLPRSPEDGDGRQTGAVVQQELGGFRGKQGLEGGGDARTFDGDAIVMPQEAEP